MTDATPHRAAGEMLTAAQLAKRLGVNRETIYRQTAAGKLPHYRTGGVVRYDWAEIRAVAYRGARDEEGSR